MWFMMIIFVSQCSCSKQPLRIYGGSDAKPDEYLYVVRIEIQRYYRNKNKSISYHHDHMCTASALSSVWVLSAAHCLENLDEFYDGYPYSVEKLIIRHGHVEHLPGIHDSFSDVLFTVSYPLYAGNPDLTKHDIALLKTYPMNIKSYVKLSAVDYKCFYGHKSVLAGFGITTKTLPDETTETGSTLVLKKPLQLLEVLITKCNPAENVILGLCLASRCGHASTPCGGDSGGPLLHSSGVIGVLSRGPASGFCLHSHEKETDNIVGYVIPVTPYIDWIYHIMKKKIKKRKKKTKQKKLS